MAFEKIQSEIYDYIEKGNALSSLEKGEKFLDWVLVNLFNKTEVEMINYDLYEGVLRSDGPNDRGIDAAFVESDVLYLIQTKYFKSHSKEQVPAFYDKI